MVKVTLDAETFKALASPTRLGVMRSLDERRKTVSELARDLEMNKATIHEHLQLLTASGLIRKCDDEGRKWIYYELTWRGERILHPQETTTFNLLLGISVAAAGGGTAMLGRALGWWLQEQAVRLPEAAPMGPAPAGDVAGFRSATALPTIEDEYGAAKPSGQDTAAFTEPGDGDASGMAADGLAAQEGGTDGPPTSGGSPDSGGGGGADGGAGAGGGAPAAQTTSPAAQPPATSAASAPATQPAELRDEGDYQNMWTYLATDSQDGRRLDADDGRYRLVQSEPGSPAAEASDGGDPFDLDGDGAFALMLLAFSILTALLAMVLRRQLLRGRRDAAGGAAAAGSAAGGDDPADGAGHPDGMVDAGAADAEGAGQEGGGHEGDPAEDGGAAGPGPHRADDDGPGDHGRSTAVPPDESQGDTDGSESRT